MPSQKTPKRFAVTLDPTDTGKGMKLVSLVKTPAIGQGWVALASDEHQPVKRVHLSAAATGEAKQVLTGPLLIPDLPILRIDENGEEFYISFSAEQIEIIAHQFMAEAKGLALSNQNHADALEGNQIRELWLMLDGKLDKAAALGFDLPAGTLMASMKVADSDFWKNEVETGNVTGFSIEGLFDFSELKLQAASAAPKKRMSFKSVVLSAIARLSAALSLASVELDDSTELEVDDATGAVYALKEDGTRGEAYPDGTYKLKDGTAFEVKDGKHVGHKAPEAEKPAEEKLAEEKPVDNKSAVAPEAAAEVEKLLGSIETEIADVRKLLKGEKPAEEKPKTDDKAGDTKLSAAVRARAEKDPVKLAAIELALQTVEMADGSSVNYNPITRSLTDSTGALLKTGYYACADGNYFKVSTDQYTYEIDAETYAKATTQLSAVELELSELKRTKPAGSRIKLGEQTTENQADLPAWKVQLNAARAKQKAQIGQ
ncbi:XkdF-like putative serine protease domain-containing protein [Hymenobacter sp. M29]|uniref:XkdF-like putative serine protease domain-containing protein n=1 Tax=Hymenobacter mellowenesis TaxID=3063995 RepID=A0ABT9AGN0_9BACT|nr:XkdF-like putative serine protease domain-containing protein [Hymenobacter sp. M29]MDO7849026.1 XkdF-like putative serine protease domain-containing protein [Hymenobacter sp. M29]